MRLYGIEDRLNKAIRDFAEGYAAIDVYREGALFISLPFVQVMEVSEGLIFTTGQDDYTPSRPMHFVEGEVNIDEKERSITVTMDGKTAAVIRAATLDEESMLLSYVGMSTPEDQERIAGHIRQFKAACQDFDSFDDA